MDDASTTGVGAAIAALAVITVALRFYTRYTQRHGLRWDDWLILASLSFLIATDILVVYGGYRRSQPQLPLTSYYIDTSII
jgi:integral membrane sensor domain MASE1